MLHHRKSKGIPKNIYFCFIGYAKAFDCVDHSKLWNVLEEMGLSGQLICLLRTLYVDKKHQLELDMEQQNGSKLGKEYVKAVYCHPAYLIYMLGTSCKKLGWINPKLESGERKKISTTSDMHRIPLYWYKRN